ncbi:RNA-protein complex protein Nop10 [Methanothermococcus sp. SCGC AD-155-E23]|nr:RNA-protein complex protein Nop10 [Methanothermococcus sp. SCGC AD-155-E23]
MRIRKCPRCKRYTLKDICSVCGEKTVTVKPPRFSLEDRYGKYRRMLKRSLKSKEKSSQ